MSARSASATADYGSSYLLLAITIAVLGGTNPLGGRAPIVGVGADNPCLERFLPGFRSRPTQWHKRRARNCQHKSVLVRVLPRIWSTGELSIASGRRRLK